MHSVQAWWGRKLVRTVHIVEGATYRIEPLNPKAKKNRGRLCCVIDEGAIKRPTRVRYLDTGRVGRADPADLVAVGKKP